MVYCGKPSKSCRQCRNRNIKCDKKRPACGQCLRASLTCPGYPDPDNLLIRNETSLTIHRVFNQQTSHLQSQSQSPIPISPNISVIDRAKCVFVSTQVFGSRASFSYMREFFPPKPSDDFLINAVQAVCLAYFANDVGDLDVMKKALLKYGEALVAMVKALGRKGQAARKEAMATVLFMDCFEKLVKDEPGRNGLSSGGDINEKEPRHLVGAIALCKFRGPAQFEDPLAVSLFHHLSCNIISSCLERGVAIPVDYMQLRVQAAAFMSDEDAKWKAENLLIDFIDLKGKLQSHEIDEEEADGMLQRLKGEYEKICEMFPRMDEKKSQDVVVENPWKERNNLASVKDVIDEVFRDGDRIMSRGS